MQTLPLRAYLSIGIGPAATLVAETSFVVTSVNNVDVPIFTCVSLQAGNTYFLTITAPSHDSPPIARWQCVESVHTHKGVTIYKGSGSNSAYSGSATDQIAVSGSGGIAGNPNYVSPWLSSEVNGNADIGLQVYTAPVTAGPKCPRESGATAFS